MMKKRIISVIFIILLMFTVSCDSKDEIPKSTSNDKEYIYGEDYNYTAVSWLQSPGRITAGENGFFFIRGLFLYYYDFSTGKAEVMCSNPACLHDKETDLKKVPDCGGFIGSQLLEPFVAYWHQKIYLTKHNLETNKPMLVEMDPGGTNQKIIIEDVSKINLLTCGIHRGVLYYIESGVNLEGDKVSRLAACSLIDGKYTKYSIMEFEGRITPSVLLPYGNKVFFELGETVNNEDGTLTFYTKIYSYNIKNGSVENVTEDGYSIYGISEGKLVLRKDGFIYLMDIVDGKNEIVLQENGWNAFVENHSQWNCHPDMVDEGIAFFTCYDNSPEVQDFVGDTYVVNQEGETLCVVPDVAWNTNGKLTVQYGDETYYIRHTNEMTTGHAINVYKKSDLMNGIVDPIPVLEVSEITAESYIYDSN